MPVAGLKFKTTRQPIDTELWPMHLIRRQIIPRSATTAEGSDVEFNGQVYKWDKHHEWESSSTCPSELQPSELPPPRERRREKRIESFGWKTCSPFNVVHCWAYPNIATRGQFGR